MKEYEINIPLKWDDIKLDTYQKLLELYDLTDNKPEITDIISILSNINKEELSQYPVEVMTVILSKLEYLKELPTEEANNEITINGEKYIINNEEKLKFGEFVDTQMLMKNDKNNIATLLAILCRKENEIYDDDYISNVLPDRIKMYEKQPVTTIQPLVNFLQLLSLISQENMKQYSTQFKQIINQYINFIRNIKVNGIGKKYSLSLLKRKLKTLKKRVNNI